MASLFEGYERRIDQINAVLNSYGISSIEEAEKITKDAGLDVYDQVKKIQPICFENACWAYTVGAAIAIKKGCRKAADAAAAIGGATDTIASQVAATVNASVDANAIGAEALSTAQLDPGYTAVHDGIANAVGGYYAKGYGAGTAACCSVVVAPTCACAALVAADMISDFLASIALSACALIASCWLVTVVAACEAI